MICRDTTGTLKLQAPRYIRTLTALGLSALTILLYRQVQFHDFVNFDDFEYVVNNPNVRFGLSVGNIWWAFTNSYSFNWHPLTWISHMVDCGMFGLNPGAHHMSNLLLHTANSVLLFYVLHRMTRTHWRSAFVAGLFAIHPLHVESVAWISERKDVLCAFFVLLSLLAYTRYTERRGIGRYLLVLLFFAMALSAKPMAVTLPFLLILLDWWPLNGQKRSAAALLFEKIPFLLFSAASGLITYLIHSGLGSIVSIPFADRLENALFSYLMYLLKTFWPLDLACFYPHPFGTLGFKGILAGFLLLLPSAAAIAYLRKAPYFLTGWLWFLGVLVPVSGIIQAGEQGMADRYTYISLIGIFIIIAWGATDLFDAFKVKVHWRILLGIAVSLPLLAVSYGQIQYWRDSFTLFQREISVNDQKHFGFFHLATSYELRGDLEKAVLYYSEAVRIQPEYKLARYHLANAFATLEKFPEAEREYSILLKQDPLNYKAHNNLGAILIRVGREEEASFHFRKGIEISPDPMMQKNLEQLLKRLDQHDRESRKP